MKDPNLKSRRLPVVGPEAEEVKDLHGILTYPGTWGVAWKEIGVPVK